MSPADAVGLTLICVFVVVAVGFISALVAYQFGVAARCKETGHVWKSSTTCRYCEEDKPADA